MRRVHVIGLVVALFASCPGPALGYGEFADGPREEKFRQEVRSADRIRVRSGGTCHRQVDSEATLFEIKDRQGVDRLLAAIEIDDEGGGFHCACCGDPTFEFYSGTTLVASLGFHHGQTLRWVDGWEDDSLLTAESGKALCEWLAEHGVKEPLEEWQEGQRTAEAAALRYAFYERAIPKEILEALGAADSEEKAIAAFTSHVGGADAAKLYFEVLGSALYAWEGADQLESLIMQELLPLIAPADVLRAVEMVVDEPSGLRGAARWILWRAKWEGLDAAALGKLTAPLGRAGLSHPAEETRRRVLWALWRIGTPQACMAIRARAWGNIPIIEATPEEMAEPSGMRTMMIQKDDVESKLESTAAVVYLSRLGDKQSLDIAERLLAASPPEDRELLTEAVRRLREK